MQTRALTPWWTLTERISVRLEFKPPDCWIGVYPRVSPAGQLLDVWICLLPMLPIHIQVWRARR